MGNYDARGSNIGALGDNSQAREFTQSGNAIIVGDASVDSASLVIELQTVRARLEAMVASGYHPADDEPSLDAVNKGIVAIGSGEQAARDGNSSGVVESLKQSGKWLASFAEKVGASVVASIVRASVGLP